MRVRWLLLAIGVLGLVSSTQFLPPSAQTLEEAARYFETTDIENGRRYEHQRLWLYWAGQVAQLTLLLVLVFSRWGSTLVARVRRFSGGRWLVQLLALAGLYLALTWVLLLPVRVGRHMHLAAWGMTSQPWASWWRDQALGLVVYAVSSTIPLVGLYGVMRVAPRTWWLWSALGVSGLAVVYAYLFPIVVAPLFNTFTPLRETAWKDRESRIQALIAKAKIEVGDILVADASRRSSHSNAYFAGFGPSRRIVLYDTLLMAHDDAEIDTILAHELGHWLHDHIVKGVLLGTLAALVGMLVLRRVLSGAARRGVLDMTSAADPAGLYLVLLLIWAGEWVALPIGNAVSRHFERQADRVSLELTQDPESFQRAERTLAKKNIGNVVPSTWNTWLFATHPPYLERIQMAESWKRVEQRP
jgi:STE24 endopeptidase